MLVALLLLASFILGEILLASTVFEIKTTKVYENDAKIYVVGVCG